MKKIIHVLCEGQTEQGFVEAVLKPYLLGKDIVVKSILVTTNKKKNAQGGLVTYLHAYNDLSTMLRLNADGEYERHIFTTMFDLYALPDDFPEYAKCHSIVNKYERVKSFEKAFSKAINSDRFVPYIQLHEFEALVFCGLDSLKLMYKESAGNIDKLKEDLAKIGNPELVNDHPQTAPSKRIIKAIEGDKKHYHYDKPKAGKFVTEQVGIDALREMCAHFNEWIEKLIKI